MHSKPHYIIIIIPSGFVHLPQLMKGCLSHESWLMEGCLSPESWLMEGCLAPKVAVDECKELEEAVERFCLLYLSHVFCAVE
jgi:hypothetical protein